MTLPKQVRELLRLEPGDRVDFVVGEDGQVRLKPGRLHVVDLKGLLHEPDRPAVSLEEMEGPLARTACSANHPKDPAPSGGVLCLPLD